MSTDVNPAPGRHRSCEPFHSVLVPLDGSALALEALPTAVALADRFGVPVEAVTVSNGDGWFEQRHALAPLEAAGIPLRVLAGRNPAPAIVRHAEDPALDLICMATHGHGRIVGSVFGSVAESVMRHSARPLVAVGPGVGEGRLGPDPVAPLAVPRLVACVDGSADSEQVLPIAAAWAGALGMELTILQVAEPAPQGTVPAGTRSHPRRVPADQAREHVAALAADWTDSGPEVTGAVALDPVSPAAGVRAHLRDRPAGLLATSTHARAGARRLWSGSVAAAIVHDSTVPVLVVPLT